LIAPENTITPARELSRVPYFDAARAREVAPGGRAARLTAGHLANRRQSVEVASSRQRDICKESDGERDRNVAIESAVSAVGWGRLDGEGRVVDHRTRGQTALNQQSCADQ